ncbi:MAG: HAD-IA family hydrolase [Phycisphaera sp.]|nr:HAD-IA family hydrolase [Phycisphaera sp.]
MSFRRVELVVFDLGGVLIRCVSGWREACDRAGVPYSRELADPKFKAEFVKITKQFETGVIGHNAYAEAVAKNTSYQASQVLQILGAWLIELYPGVAEMLEVLGQSGIETAILSNTNPVHWKLIHEAPQFSPLNVLQNRFASHLIGCCKPKAAAYEHVESHTNIDPKKILFFDDLEDNVNAAAWQDWKTKRIDSSGDTVGQIEKYLRRYGVIE